MASSLKDLYDRLVELQRTKNQLVFALAEDELGDQHLSQHQRVSARETIAAIESELAEVQARIREHMNEYEGP
jgi:hypothetical protein